MPAHFVDMDCACVVSSAPCLTQVPVTFIYGDHDWMDPAGAHRAAAGMAERRPAAGPGDQQVITVKVCLHVL